MKAHLVLLAAAALSVVPAAVSAAPDSAEGAPQFTSGQVSAGKSIYSNNCASCHGGSLEGTNDAPALSGDFFSAYWDGKTVADLYNYMHDFMPPTAPGTLAEEDYLNITAYVLSEFGHAAGEEALNLEGDPSSMIIGAGIGE